MLCMSMVFLFFPACFGFAHTSIQFRNILDEKQTIYFKRPNTKIMGLVTECCKCKALSRFIPLTLEIDFEGHHRSKWKLSIILNLNFNFHVFRETFPG